MAPQPTAIRLELKRLEAILEANPDDAAALDAVLDAEERLVKAEGAWIDWALKVNGKDSKDTTPRYPALATLNRFRKATKKGAAYSDDYGQAVGDAILALQRKEAERGIVESRPCPCASGTYASDAESIVRAIKARQARELTTFRPLDTGEWQKAMREKYERAMAEKRDAQQAAEAATAEVLSKAKRKRVLEAA